MPAPILVPQISPEQCRQSFAEFERIHGITEYSYDEVGYGYRLNESKPTNVTEAEFDLTDTPLLTEIEALADSIAN